MGITYTNAAQAEVHDYEAAEEILDAVKISSPGIHTMKFMDFVQSAIIVS